MEEAMRDKLVAWADAHLVANWRQWHRLWSVRIAIFWTVIEAVYTAFPAFQDTMPPWVFLCACVFISLLLLFARLTHQPGLD